MRTNEYFKSLHLYEELSSGDAGLFDQKIFHLLDLADSVHLMTRRSA